MAVTTEGGDEESRRCSPSAKWTRRRRRKCFVDSVADADAVGQCDGTEAEEDCSPCGVEVLVSANRRLLRMLFGFNDGGVIMVVESIIIWPSSQSLSSLSLEKMCAADGTVLSSLSHSSSSKSTGC